MQEEDPVTGTLHTNNKRSRDHISFQFNLVSGLWYLNHIECIPIKMEWLIAAVQFLIIMIQYDPVSVRNPEYTGSDTGRHKFKAKKSVKQETDNGTFL